MVPSIAGLAISSRPQVVRAHRTARFVLSVVNRGNTALDVALGAVDPERLVVAQLEPPNLVLPPATAADVLMTLKGPRMFVGTELDRPITVEATAAIVPPATTPHGAGAGAAGTRHPDSADLPAVVGTRDGRRARARTADRDLPGHPQAATVAHPRSAHRADPAVDHRAVGRGVPVRPRPGVRRRPADQIRAGERGIVLRRPQAERRWSATAGARRASRCQGRRRRPRGRRPRRWRRRRRPPRSGQPVQVPGLPDRPDRRAAQGRHPAVRSGRGDQRHGGREVLRPTGGPDHWSRRSAAPPPAHRRRSARLPPRPTAPTRCRGCSPATTC